MMRGMGGVKLVEKMKTEDLMHEYLCVYTGCPKKTDTRLSS